MADARGRRIPELGLDFVPTPDAAYFYDGYTRPDARRRGIDALVRQAIFDMLRAQGRQRVYSYVRADNPGVLRAAERCQRAVGVVRSVRLLGSGPLVLGRVAPPLSSLLRRRSGPAEAAMRAAEWRGWFEGWLGQPLARRSIGFTNCRRLTSRRWRNTSAPLWGSNPRATWCWTSAATAPW